ncbi:MAG TPA: hypothetical protein VGV18_09435 [Verrucomicrobiae bacterium]|nr:hypothetical protein [Verrucomicrobiae bacterium]
MESKSNVTVELVERVSRRVGLGIPLLLALAGEGVSCAEYEERLRGDARLADLDHLAKRQVQEYFIAKLLGVEDPSSNIRWLLERIQSDALNGPRESAAVNVPTVAGMSEEELRLFQEEAKRL